MRNGRAARTAVVVGVVLLQACGGGGGDLAPSTPVETAAPPLAAPAPAPAPAPGVCRKAAAPRRTVPGLGQGTPEADAATMGMWSPVLPWTLIPLHAALTADGRVMSFGTTAQGRQTGRFVYSVWDPAAGTGLDAHMLLPNSTRTDLFCSAQMNLPQGGMFISGGDNYVNGNTNNLGTADTTLFDPARNTLTQGPTMFRARWYGTPTMLANGEVLLNGGWGSVAGVNPDHPEVRQADGTFRLLTGVDSSRLHYYYPRAYTARDGRVFGFENNRLMYFVDAAGSGRLSPAGGMTHFMAGDTATAALFQPGRVLVAGGYSRNASVIDFTGPHAVETPTAPLSAVRERLNLTVLPDGRVLGTGGSGVDNELIAVTNQAEIWSPTTGQWTMHASGQIARLYHSIALLLPDGSVLVGGGGAPGPLINTNAELFFPPYLFAEDGSWAVRHRIVAATTAADPGTPIELQVQGPRPIARVSLVKFGAVSHQVNFEQRFVELPFTADGDRLTARLPANAGDLPPGFWMVFALDDRGVPSMAATLRVNVAAAPSLDTDWTPSFGGTIEVGGDRFTLACGADEVMVGVRGESGTASGATVVGRIGPVCVPRDAAGRWAGTPQQRGVVGGGGGAAFERMCPSGQAVVSVQGRSGLAVDQVAVGCRPLDGTGRVAGVATVLDAAGGNGGQLEAPLVCGDGRPATGLYGRASSALQNVGLLCGVANASPGLPAPPAPAPEPPPPPAPAPPPPPPSTAAATTSSQELPKRNSDHARH